MLTPRQKQRKYRLHYNLRRKGNEVYPKIKLVTMRASEVSTSEDKWIRELVDFGYSCGPGLFPGMIE